jgi:hypothetical protein
MTSEHIIDFGGSNQFSGDEWNSQASKATMTRLSVIVNHITHFCKFYF